MQYQVRWLEVGGTQVREAVEDATSTEDLASRLAGQGRLLLSAKAAGAEQSWSKLPLRLGSKLDVAWWCQELRTLLSAGMTVVEAIDTLHAQPLGVVRARVHGQLVAALQSGQPLSRAMAETGQFPDVLVAGVRASERTSNLIEALDDYLRYHDIMESLRKQVVSAAIYPAVVLGLGTVIVLFLLLHVVPRFSAMYAGVASGLSWPTQMMLWLSAVLSGNAPMLLGGLAGVLAALVLWLAMDGARHAAAWLVENVPYLRRRADAYRLAKLYQALALLFKGGYALDQALAQCESLALGKRWSARLESASAALARGARVSAAFEQAELTDGVSQRLLAVGERTGNFDRVLQTIAQRHSRTFITFVERATRLAEPLLLMAVAMVVGAIVVLLYMPIFDMAGSVGG